MVVSSIEIPPRQQGVLQRCKDRCVEVLSEIGIQRGNSLRCGGFGDRLAVAGAVGHVDPHTVCCEPRDFSVGGVDIIRLRKGIHRVIDRQTIDRRILIGIRAVENIVAVGIVAGGIHRVAVLVQFGGRYGVGARGHTGAGLKIRPER